MKKIEAETPFKKGFGDKEVQLASPQAPRQLLIILKIAPRKREPAGNGYGLRDWVKGFGGILELGRIWALFPGLAGLAVGFGVGRNMGVVSWFGGGSRFWQLGGIWALFQDLAGLVVGFGF